MFHDNCTVFSIVCQTGNPGGQLRGAETFCSVIACFQGFVQQLEIQLAMFKDIIAQHFE